MIEMKEDFGTLIYKKKKYLYQMKINIIFKHLSFIVFIIIPSFCYCEGIKDYLEKGDESYSKFNNVEALSYYEKAHNITPDNFDVLLRLVKTYNAAGEEYYEYRNRTEAEYYINKALEFADKFRIKFPDSSAVYTYSAMSNGNIALFKGGKEKIKYAKLVEQNAKKSISLNPNAYLPYIILGIYYREIAGLSWLERAFANTFFGNVPSGSYEESESMLKKALSFDPNMIVANYQLAKTYRQMDRGPDEKSLLQKVLILPIRDFRDKFAIEKAQKRLNGISK
jgi:tetratricopeptide (TPR) repeat protein